MKKKCFICEKEFECKEGSLADELGFCMSCLLGQSVTVIDDDGKIVKQEPIPKEKQDEMIKRIENYLKKK